MKRTRRASPEYARAHHAARKTIARQCERCGATPVQAALHPETPTERLLFDAGINCYYSLERTDYFALCHPCHRHLDGVELRTHCKHGHEYTETNTVIRSGGARRCRTCRNEQERLRMAIPVKREAKRIYNLERRPEKSDEAKARHIQQQRERRSSESPETKARRNQRRREMYAAKPTRAAT